MTISTAPVQQIKDYKNHPFVWFWAVVGLSALIYGYYSLLKKEDDAINQKNQLAQIELTKQFKKEFTGTIILAPDDPTKDAPIQHNYKGADMEVAKVSVFENPPMFYVSRANLLAYTSKHNFISVDYELSKRNEDYFWQQINWHEIRNPKQYLLHEGIDDIYQKLFGEFKPLKEEVM